MGCQRGRGAFDRPANAIRAAVAAQLSLVAADWGEYFVKSGLAQLEGRMNATDFAAVVEPAAASDPFAIPALLGLE